MFNGYFFNVVVSIKILKYNTCLQNRKQTFTNVHWENTSDEILTYELTFSAHTLITSNIVLYGAGF